MLNGYREIRLKSLFAYVFKKLWIAAIAAIIFGTAAFFITKFAITPQYCATVRLYVNNKTEASSSLTSSDVSAAKSLVDTYITIIKSNSVVDVIVPELNYKYTNEQIKSMITAKAVNGTEVFDVKITGAFPEECAIIANLIAELAPNKISSIVFGSSVKTIDNATTPTAPISPSLPKNVAIACFLGLMFSCAALVITYMSDTSIYAEDDIKEFCALPILGIFPDLAQTSRNDHGYAYGGRSPEK